MTYPRSGTSLGLLGSGGPHPNSCYFRESVAKAVSDATMAYLPHTKSGACTALQLQPRSGTEAPYRHRCRRSGLKLVDLGGRVYRCLNRQCQGH